MIIEKVQKERKFEHITYSAKEIFLLIGFFTILTTLILALHPLTTTTTVTTAPPTGPTSLSTIRLTQPLVDPPNTLIRPTYDSNGNPPTAPGLAMKARVFETEPAKIVYITIDDGPYIQNTPHLLEVLKKENIKVTFFDIGKQIEQFPSLLKAEYEQGHSIGNHTYSHNYNAIYQSPETFLADVQKNDDLIFKVIGIHPRIIRAPGGTSCFNINYYNLLDANDYMAYDWNLDTKDTDGNFSVQQIVDNVDKQIGNKHKIILLMHDLPNKSSSTNALPIIIKHLKAKGYTFGTLNTQIKPITFSEGFYKK
ncbi:MAG: polysaccharide deacetylase [Desulfosporosinus sp.]|nr:polysaccharide deacetylase [Desulfosporosinus sp.]